METIIVALITGGLSLIGVIITNLASNHKTENSITTSQAVTDTKLDELTREVRLHNNFALRIPVIETQITNIEQRVSNLENQGR